MIEPIRKILQTPFGLAECDARFWPSSPDLPLTYSCWLFETRENWVFPQSLIRACESMETPSHGIHSAIAISDELLRSYAPHIIRHKQSPFYNAAKKIIGKRK